MHTKRDWRAQNNKDVIEALGTPVDPGFFVTGAMEVSGPSGHADLAIPLSGPQGEGTLYVKAEKIAGQWEMRRLEVEVEGHAERIDLLSEQR